MSSLLRPRLTDYHKVYIAQSAVDFAIPFLNEDIPLYVDPFLLWRSPSYQDQAIHTSIINSFNQLGHLVQRGKHTEAIEQLVMASECDEVGLGHSANRRGKRFGKNVAEKILSLFDNISVYNKRGFTHFEEIQFFIDGISADRISDIACNFMKSFLIDFTIEQCQKFGLPLANCTLQSLYNQQNYSFEKQVQVSLPVHPESGSPILLIPKRWLRFGLWLNFDDYFTDYCPKDERVNPDVKVSRVNLLNFNRDNYGVVEAFIKEKELTAADCHNDPLFAQIPILSAKRKLSQILSLPTGKTDNADKKYEKHIEQLMASLLYPALDFATEQSRTEEGVLIRDLIFYNTRSNSFLQDIFNEYETTQLVMELKNVEEIKGQHINQLNRYLSNSFGKFGVLVTRNELPKAMRKNTVDLWSGQRKCIITVTDTDLSQMVDLFESKQRSPIDVLNKKFVEFKQLCPQ